MESPTSVKSLNRMDSNIDQASLRNVYSEHTRKPAIILNFGGGFAQKLSRHLMAKERNIRLWISGMAL